MYRYLVIEDGVLVMHSKPVGPGPDTDTRMITNLDELRAVVTDDDIVMCSSSLDFPEEHTKDAHIIAMCDEIRGCSGRHVGIVPSKDKTERLLQTLRVIQEISYAGGPDGRESRLEMIGRYAAAAIKESLDDAQRASTRAGAIR